MNEGQTFPARPSSSISTASESIPVEALALTALAVQALADVQVKTVRASSKEARHPELVLTISRSLLLSREESFAQGKGLVENSL